MGKHLFRSLFLIKLQAVGQDALAHVFTYEFYQNVSRTVFVDIVKSDTAIEL